MFLSHYMVKMLQVDPSQIEKLKRQGYNQIIKTRSKTDRTNRYLLGGKNDAGEVIREI